MKLKYPTLIPIHPICIALPEDQYYSCYSALNAELKPSEKTLALDFDKLTEKTMKICISAVVKEVVKFLASRGSQMSHDELRYVAM